MANEMMGIFMLAAVFFPVVAGIFFLVPASKGLEKNRSRMHAVFTGALAAELILCIFAAGGGTVTLLRITENICVSLRADAFGSVFMLLTALMWLAVGIFSGGYLTGTHCERRFLGVYLLVEGVLCGLDMSENMVTMYLFFEFMTITSLPMVLHEQTKEAVMAGLKYLFYSVGGAFMALFGILYFCHICPDLTFVPGGILTAQMADANRSVFNLACICLLVGFGTKAGLFPMHSWLPTAHPVAPAAASALLSGVIAKSGVLAIARTFYFVVGTELVRGSLVQHVWLVLSLVTVFMGSMLAYSEPVFKKRLAYSTVSQVSYVLFGLGLMDRTAFAGAMSHVIFHSVIKTGLFMCAGAVIFCTGKTRVAELKGLGRQMPAVFGSLGFLSLGLVGIPPFSGFVSKWYLATGALTSKTGAAAYAGPAVLLVSALLTAGYLFPLVIDGFLPGDGFSDTVTIRGDKKTRLAMAVPIVFTAAATLFLGLFPGVVTGQIFDIAAAVFA